MPNECDHNETSPKIQYASASFREVINEAVDVAKEMFLDGYYKVIVLGSGPCKKCSECNMNVCNFPGQTAPSMEACGIDVFQTVRKNGYEITTLRNKTEIPNYFGLILVE